MYNLINQRGNLSVESNEASPILWTENLPNLSSGTGDAGQANTDRNGSAATEQN